jgi:6-phosphogluconolactonase
MNIKAIAMALSLGVATLAIQAADAAGSLVYIGTHGTSQTATGPLGIYVARLDSKTGKLAPLGVQTELQSISWLLPHPSRPFLYAVVNPGGSITVESQLYSYSVDKATGKLRQIGQVGTGGKDTTHLAFDARSSTLFGASHASGEVTALPVQADGSPGKLASSQKHYGTGPLPRQSFPQPHAVAIDPTHRYLLSPDLGADRIFVNHFDGATRALTPAAPPFEASSPGSGPRHLVFHPNGRFVYLNTEMAAEVRVYQWDAKQGQLHLVEVLSAYPAGYSGTEKSSAEIGFSRDGRHLYVTLRGDQNSIVAYDVDGKSGRLAEIQRIDSQGKSPRSFGIDPTGRWMIVTHDTSGTVNVFGIDKATGKLSPTGESLPIPTAASVAFYAE